MSDSSLLPVLFTATPAGSPEQQLTCCVREAGTEYELVVVDASQSHAWSTTFSLAAVNAALADEELSGAELRQVLATVLPCAQAVMAVLQPGSAAGQLRLEAWCHRTQRVPLLPPTQQQRQPDSDYRQAAFCISMPVSQDMNAPQWMQEQKGQGFSDANTRLLAAMLLKDQDLRGAALRLQAQLQLLHSHAAQLQLVADKAVRTAVRGTAGLKDDPTKHQQQQQQGTAPGKLGGGFASNTVAGLRSASQHAGLALLSSSQVPGAAAAAGVPPVQRVGSGGNSSRPFAGAASGGGRAHLARQSQDEGALRQMFGEQQVLTQEWQQLQQLVGYQGPWDAFVQLAQQAGRSGVVATALQRHTALPWHLGQQQQQEQQGPHELRLPTDRGQSQEAGIREQAAGPGAQAPGAAGDDADAEARFASTLLSDSQPGSRTAALPPFAPAAAGAAVNTAPPDDQIAVVARPKQKQAEGVKRKAPAGGSLLKRRR